MQAGAFLREELGVLRKKKKMHPSGVVTRNPLASWCTGLNPDHMSERPEPYPLIKPDSWSNEF